MCRASFVVPLFVVLIALTSSVRGADVEQPNILFIMVDDLGKDWISCYGADSIQTPNIDGLAKSGLKFHNAWSMPQCTPTRVTLLTGQYPWWTGWVNHWDTPRWGVGYFDWERNKTFAGLMRSAGYKTAIAGKWQINDFRVEPNALDKHGFDDWCVWTGYEGQNPPSAERYWNAYIHTRAGSKTYSDKFGPDVYCDFLVDFMEQHRQHPMMLYFPMALTHGPLTHTPSEPKVAEKGDKLKAMVRYTDRLVGRIVGALDRLQIRKRTIVIFTTDNGTSGGLLGTINGKRPSGGKASKYEGGVCEPFIVNCPGLVPQGETDALTDFTDLLPTFAELGGAKITKEYLPLHGRSLAPLLLGKADDSPRRWIMALGHGAARLDAEGVRGKDDYASRVIRDKRYKVWVNSERRIESLYDLKDDPLEQEDLLTEVTAKQLGAALRFRTKLPGDPLTAEQLAAVQRFQDVVQSMPVKDARPKYGKRKPMPWDKKPSDGKAKRRRRRDKKDKRKRSPS